MVGVSDNDGTGFSSLCGVNEPAFRTGVFPEPLHGRGGRIDDAHDARNRYEVAVPDIDEPVLLHGVLFLLEVLHLFAAFLEFVLVIDNEAGQLDIGNLVSAGVNLAETFLQGEVKAASHVAFLLQKLS